QDLLIASKKALSPDGESAQTVDKCARTHRNPKQENFVLKFISILIYISATWYRTMSLKVSMLAVFSRLEYLCTPVARRKRHRPSFLGSLQLVEKPCFAIKQDTVFCLNG
ncbi:MAG: hypothetical protein ACI4GB_05910, partial [Acutalibacteraceae bacterium]